MTAEEQVLVQYRLERAREALDEAKLLFEAGHLHTYVNRLYYACFYAMSALLLTRACPPVGTPTCRLCSTRNSSGRGLSG